MQQVAGRKQELRSQLQRLVAGQAEAENRARVAAEMRHMDVPREDPKRLAGIAERAGGVVNNIDNRTVDSSSHVHQTVVDQNVHNHMVQLIQNNTSQFGEYMRKNRMSQVQMMRLLQNHAIQMVIHYMGGASQQPREDEPMMQFVGGGSQPPPPPGEQVHWLFRKRGELAGPKKYSAILRPWTAARTPNFHLLRQVLRRLQADGRQLFQREGELSGPTHL